MPRGPKPTPLTLSGDERAKLTDWANRPTSAQRLATRARIVLLAADGRANTAIAAHLRLTQPTVRKWRERFAARRLDGLTDDPRPGTPRTVTDEQVEAAVTRTLESTPTDATHWSTRTLGRELGLSQTAVSRIWRAFGRKPHRHQTFKLSTDPFFVEKVRDVVGLYLAPPDIHVVMDNYGTHKHPKVRAWFVRHPEFVPHFTPTSGSWLNQVERFFAQITTRRIRRGSFKSVGELEAAIEGYLRTHNERPSPFVWTKPADLILRKVQKIAERLAPPPKNRKRTSDSGH
jgi:transposase